MKRSFLPLFLALLSFSLTAQEGRNPDKIKSLKVGFITQELELTSQEAEKFWPVFNEYDKQMSQLNEERIESLKKLYTLSSDASEDEIQALIQKGFKAERSITELREKFHKKFVAILPLYKVAKLYAVELEFQRKVMQHIRSGKKRMHTEEQRELDGRK
jgi:Spy/CpxP family protein refolding chaperone